MGRERQKKKNRSSIPRVRNTRAQIGRTKKGRRKMGDFSGSAGKVVHEHWDRSLTLLQNYRRLGLTSRLNGTSGGLERRKRTINEAKRNDVDAVDGAGDTIQEKGEAGYVDNVDGRAFSILDRGEKRSRGRKDQLAPEEVKVDRDPDTGRIVRILQAEPDTSTRWGKLDDPLNSESDSDSEPPKDTELENSQPPPPSTSVIAELEAQARAETAAMDSRKQKRPRQQNQREAEWIGRLVAKHGDGFRAMAWDRKMNPMQYTEAEIRRRVARCRAASSGSGEGRQKEGR